MEDDSEAFLRDYPPSEIRGEVDLARPLNSGYYLAL